MDMPTRPAPVKPRAVQQYTPKTYSKPEPVKKYTPKPATQPRYKKPESTTTTNFVGPMAPSYYASSKPATASTTTNSYKKPEREVFHAGYDPYIVRHVRNEDGTWSKPGANKPAQIPRP